MGVNSCIYRGANNGIIIRGLYSEWGDETLKVEKKAGQIKTGKPINEGNKYFWRYLVFGDNYLIKNLLM